MSAPGVTMPAEEVAAHKATIVAMVSEGKTMRSACEAIGISRMTYYRWLKRDPDFAEAMEEARTLGHDAIADEAMGIADDTAEDPASRKVRVWTRLQLLAKWAPKRYGEASLIKLAGSDGAGPVEQSLTVRFVRSDGDGGA